MPLFESLALPVSVANGGTGGSAASITLFNNITGYTAAGATGTTSTNLVFSTSPTLTTPVLGAATGTTLALGTTPATAGILMIPHNNFLQSRNQANNANVEMLGVEGTGGSEQVRVGNNAKQLSLAGLWTVNAGTGNLIGGSTGYALALGNSAVLLFGEATNIFAQRNSTSAQCQRIYNTFTTLNTACEYFKQDWITTANQFRMGAVKGSSSGTARVATWDYGDALASATAAITVPATSGSIVFGGGITLPSGGDIVLNTTTGTKIGTGTTQLLGFYNATPIAQGASVSDPTGGAIIDAEARTAIIALISRIEATGLIATV